jgi:hypothetical protein
MNLLARICQPDPAAPLPKKFAQGSRIMLLVWFFLVLIPLNLIWENHTQNGASRKWTVCFPNADFSQYYLAGVAARYGLWEHLYPKFKPEWSHQPGRKIWSADYAAADPEVLAKVTGLPKWFVMNCAPPPEAILCLPLACFSFGVAFKIWMTGLVLATVGT